MKTNCNQHNALHCCSNLFTLFIRRLNCSWYLSSHFPFQLFEVVIRLFKTLPLPHFCFLISFPLEVNITFMLISAQHVSVVAGADCGWPS
jgi:hypothetical protein